jgi:serine/threonine protein kinase
MSFAAGRYQVRRFLAEDCKEGVYLAHDILRDRGVTIILIKTANSDEPALACPRHEAQASGRLGVHPHIATVYDIGEKHGQLYFVSEYMEGSSIDELLQVVSERQQ